MLKLNFYINNYQVSAISVIKVDLVDFDTFSKYIIINIFNFFYKDENDCILLDYKLDINPGSLESSIILNKFNSGVNYSLNDRRTIILILEGLDMEYTISSQEFFTNLDEKLMSIYSNITESFEEINIYMMKEYQKDVIIFQE